jgi:beta-glucosidase
MHAGVDSDLPDGAAYAKLPEALSKGLVTQEQIDTAVRRMLREKFLSGLFENPYADAKAAQAITNNAEARTLAVQAARETTVLLKNDGALPLNTNIKTLAVVGPNAARVDLGGYSNVPNHTVSLLDGIRAKVGSRVKIVSAEGVRITDKGDWYSDDVVLADRDANLARIKQAVEVAKGADEIVLAIGSSSAVSREGWDKASHLGDRADIGLIAQQNELAQAMFALGKPVVVVLINGAPLSIPEVAAKANALLEAWYPGQEGGTALADILFGDANPGGKLPLTIARSIAQLPLYYNQKPTAHRGYLFDTTEPLFPFGFGLSYTTFDISAPHLAAKQVKAGDPVTVSVDVRNTGKVAGDEVVQLYLHDVVSSVTRPIKELKGFKRVTLAPGESKTVQFTLDREAFALWNQDMKRVVEPGAFEIMVGPNSVDLKTVTVDIT